MVAPSAWFRARFAAPPAGRPQRCATCLAPLEPGQVACPECGAASRGRFGPRTGPRSPTMLAAFGLAAIAAAAGVGYIALAPGPNQTTSGGTGGPAAAAAKPAAGATGPITPTPVVGATGPTGSLGATGVTVSAPIVGATGATVTPKLAVPPKIPAVTPTPKPAVGVVTPKPASSGKTTPIATSPAAKTAPVTTTSTGATTSTGTTTATAAVPATIALSTGAASTYNPYGAPTGSFGSPAKAIAGDPLSSWTYKLDPGTDGATDVGLLIALPSAQQVKAITLTTASPGMTVEFYGATGTPPALITDPGWVHLATRASLDAESTVPLDAKGKTFEGLLVWITHAPPGVNSGALSLSDVSVTG